MNRNFYYQLLGITQSESISYDDAVRVYSFRRLFRAHLRQAENDCNGAGRIRGQSYYNGTIDDYARREYGYNVKSAYVQGREKEGYTVFMQESDRIESKINAIVKSLKGFKVEYQGDPRGYTCKLFYRGKDLTSFVQGE